MGLQRQKAATPASPSVDADAQRIIALAQAATPPIAERAVAVVKAIIDQYYPADKAKISKITYKQGEPGLHVTSSGRGASTTGILEVGSYFVKKHDAATLRAGERRKGPARDRTRRAVPRQG